MKYKVLIVFTLLCFQLNAQFYTGVKMGINYSNQFYTYQSSTTTIIHTRYGTTSSNTKTQYLGNGLFGLNAGGQAGYWCKKFFAIQTEVMYMQMGFTEESNSNYNIRVNYLQWNPLVLKFLTGSTKDVQFFVSTGFGLGFALNASWNTPGGAVQDPDDPFKALQVDNTDLSPYVGSPDGSLLFGMGIAIPAGNGKVELEGRYQGSFTSVYGGDFGNAIGKSIHNSNLTFQFGYSMFLSKRL